MEKTPKLLEMMERVPIEVDVSWIMPQRGIALHRIALWCFDVEKDRLARLLLLLLLLLLCVTKVCCKEGSKEQ